MENKQSEYYRIWCTVLEEFQTSEKPSHLILLAFLQHLEEVASASLIAPQRREARVEWENMIWPLTRNTSSQRG